MKINFVEQHNLFMQYAKRNKLSSYERIFWIALFHCANDYAMAAENYEWPEDYFPVSNTEITGWTGFDERAIRNTRNSLMQKGLLDFVKGDRKKTDPKYRLYYMKRIGCEIVPNQDIEVRNSGKHNGLGAKTQAKSSIDCESAPNTVGNTVPNTVGSTVPNTVGKNGDSTLLYTNIKVNTKVNVNRRSRQSEEEKEKDNDDDGQKVYWYFVKHFGKPSQTAADGIYGYTREMGADMVIFAIDAAKTNGGKSWPYIRNVLNDYKRSGLKTPEDVMRREAEREAQKARGRKKENGREREFIPSF